MVEKKRVRFTNDIGKPLVSVREIERVGKSHKIKQEPRKFVPADMKKLKAKHEIAERRAVSALSRAEDNLSKAQRVSGNIQKLKTQAQIQLLKAKSPSNAANIKEKINKLNSAKKNLTPRLENMQLTVNVAKNKLKAQRATGLKKSRFTFV
jgi:hypothetical protein